MKTKAQLDQDIINITMKINAEFPELYKFIPEMPMNFSENRNDTISSKNLEDYYDSLVNLYAHYTKTHTISKDVEDKETDQLPGYPIYPSSEDIFQKGKEEKDINPEDLSKKKSPNEKEGTMNEHSFEDDLSGGDLDVPGSELDDQQESIGSEDEENNYYSLGGDNHNDLEEDKG